MLKNVISSLLSAAALTGFGMAYAASPSEVSISGGALDGVVEDQVVSFKGIPYAAPPVGELRWRPPAGLIAWSGVRSAAKFGPACMQSGGMFGAGSVQSEDCLTVNVWTPLHHEGRRLPVMVWVHGGGFIGGSGSTPYYDGTSFARDGVVLVSLNYRLGRLGFFAHPALVNKDAGGAVGNYGLMDQIAAFKWVKANIAAFGGDPNNVTAFGESAGGISLNFLMATRDNAGLFEKVISESGFGRFDPPPIATLEKTDVEFAKSLGVEGESSGAAAALRAIPVASLLGGITSLADPAVPRPMIDGVLIKERVDVAFSKGRQLKLPYLVGGNSFEASLFARSIMAQPELTLKQIDPDPARVATVFDDGDLIHAAFNVSTETMITEPNRDLARSAVKTGQPVFLYHFSYLPAAARSTIFGAGHGSEIGYVFQTLPLKPVTYGGRQIPAATPDDIAMSKAIHDYWVAFAKSGDPGAAGGVHWPAYRASSDELLEFGEDGIHVRSNFQKQRLDVIQADVEKVSRP